MPTAYLSLGSNIGNRSAHLQDAITRLRELGAVITSSFYETEPVEFTEQPWFLNCVVALETDLSPQDLLARILTIERAMGRDRAAVPAKGPRVIDIDVLLYGKAVVNTPELTIPHPAMHRRRFVLQPLAEIAPDAIHPVFMRSAADLLRALPAAGEVVRRVGLGKNRHKT